MEQMHSPNTLQNYNLNSIQYFENHTKPLVPKTNRKMNIFYMNKEERLLVYFVCHIEISQTTTPLVMLMVWLESHE